MITRNIAGVGCSILLMFSVMALSLAIKDSITWLMIASIIAIVVYIIGLIIVTYDYYKYG